MRTERLGAQPLLLAVAAVWLAGMPVEAGAGLADAREAAVPADAREAAGPADAREAAGPAGLQDSGAGEPRRSPPDEGPARTGPEGLPEWVSWLAGRFALHVNGASRGADRRMTDSLGFRAYDEDALVQSTHVIGGAGMVDAGGSLRLWRDLSIGASYAQLATSDATTLTGSVPHPIRHGAFRELPMQVLSFPHRQRATHGFVAWRFAVVDRIEASFFAGPSLYNLTQGVVTNVTAREAGGPPFDAVQVDLVQRGEHRRNAVGGNVGMDVTYMATRHFGVGFVVRYTTATVHLPAARTGRLSLRVGGTEVGGGLRFRF